MAVSYLWEPCMLGITLLGYAALATGAYLNRRKRLRLSEDSKAMSECERCSVDFAHRLVPTVTVPEYRFRGMHLKMSSMRIEFENLSVKLKSNKKCILEGVTGEFRPKRVAAIMGPSGAGKTTFMNALCGRAYYGTTTGSIRINGQTSSIAAIKPLRGFDVRLIVMFRKATATDDIVHEHLTVREQLYYSARLRNAEGTPPAMINNIVEDVLNVMQLLDVQHSLVGDVEKRGISGGQRKRVNIGLELAARPTILMLDEPTSGLDASTALEIIRSVKRLTAIGMTVVMVVHQPRYSLFTLFDDLLLLGLGGQTVYLGQREGALPYFRSLGFQMPQHENPADWFMDVISGIVKNEKNPTLQPKTLANAWAEFVTNVMADDVESALDAEGPGLDAFAFSKALDAKLCSAGFRDRDVLSPEQLADFLEFLHVKKPADAAWEQLMDRMGFQDGFISRQRLTSFLHGLTFSFSQDAGKYVEDFTSSEASGTSKETSISDSISDIPGKKLGRRGRFCIQYPILLHQNSIRWARDWKHKLISTVLTIFTAAVFGQTCIDKLIPENILCPLKINISHLAIGLVCGVVSLHIFGADRPLFWRESASGVGVPAFYLARAPCSFWLWLVSFRMTAVVASAVGILMSTNSTLATAVLLLVMGGALSEPQVIAEVEGLSTALAFLSPFTWTSGENYMELIAVSGGEEAVDYYAVMIVEGYKKVLLCLGGSTLGYVTLAYIFCSLFAILALVFGYLGLRFSHRGKQA
ncbi:ABC transporter G family member 24 (ABC transporter ABCG.24) (AtABCG24) (Probable white-brown complex homolog protein 25) (AtWBC25) [Durusdinium trenchii]|uniref:ABC transporter G family member 24 (ABC transporter ABCG.24) (AtABCG24) (Probable white-brown complex homolog protein 25) (AtWBC25) n=1 Tax=Durusdinium trenchii TaxID=1381693 RepID=A0ABP0MK25_9DINO